MPKRYYAIDTFFVRIENDTSSLQQIAAFHAEAKKRNDLRTQLFLDYRKFIVLKQNGAPPMQKHNMLDSLLLEAQATKDPVLMVAFYMQRAWLNYEEKKYPATFQDYLRVNDLLQTITSAEIPQKNYLLYSIGLFFYQFRDYKKAIEINMEAEPVDPDPFHRTLQKDLLGMCYLKLENYDSARYWFTEAIPDKTVPERYNAAWHGILDGNIGYTWYYQQQFDKAIPFLESGVAKTVSANIWDNAAGFLCALADISLQSGQIQKAAAYLQQARSAAAKAGDDENYFKLYTALNNYYRHTGDSRQALLFTDSMHLYETLVQTDKDSRLKVQAEYLFENEKAKANELRLQHEIRTEKNLRNVVIAGLFLLMMVLLLLYNRQRLRHTLREQQHSMEKRRAEEDLRSARQQLDDFTQSLREKNNLIEQFTSELQALQEQQTPEISQQQLETIQQLRQSSILTDEQWSVFRSRFELVHQGFLERLKTRLPELSPAETRFMTLAKLGLSNREMAGLLGVSADSMRMMRHRLRKKLSLEEEGSLEELISSV